MANVLITGASGYLGGSFLAKLANTEIPTHGRIYALVRNDTQAASVGEYNAEPIRFDPYDSDSVHKAILGHNISVVFWLIDALAGKAQPYFIDALASFKAKTGEAVHFVHTSGAKLFSSHAGAPTDGPLYDDRPDLYKVQQMQKSTLPLLQHALDTNNMVIAQSEAKGVRSYIFIPCIVYGKGLGFGNTISIQTVAIIKAALESKHVYKVDTDKPTWPVSHVQDTSSLYVSLLRAILANENPEYGPNGYYLAASGSIAWDDLYAAIALGLAKRGMIEDTIVELAEENVVKAMARGLGCPPELVPLQLGGNCTLTARHGKQIAWVAEFSASHILDAADTEVEIVLEALGKI